jgi:dTDP-4-amino-4,6-dideoxygalactose transaminase
MNTIPFNNLNPLHTLLRDEIRTAVERVLESGWYILGPEVEAFEHEFAVYHGVRHGVGVANGTDAIELALRATGIGPGDEVITVAHTAVATVCAVEQAGAHPVMVDIDATTYTIDPQAVEAAITPRTKAIIPVHLYGHPAQLDQLISLANRNNLLLIEDCAQAHGARYNGKRVGTFGHLAAFSFYPTKNLAAYGDGGIVITNDDNLAERLKRLRNYGQISRYYHQERGVNSRLDEMQAAILRIKLQHLDEHNNLRREIAHTYDNLLKAVKIPCEQTGAHHVYHLYVIRHEQRDRLMSSLKDAGIGTLIHYPMPVHLQEAYKNLGYKPGSLPVTEEVTAQILSLPLYVGLSSEQVEYVASAVNTALEEVGS